MNPTNLVISQCKLLAQEGTLKRQIKEAQDYLTEIQQSPTSWSMFCDILDTDDLEVAVYGQIAILLKQKFQFDFYQLSQTEYWNMAQLLVRYLMKHNHEGITEPLAKALVLLYMNAFETLGDLIDILENTLMAHNEKEGLGLEIIRLMAEASSLKAIVINKKQKELYSSYLASTQTSKVLAILEKHAKNETLGHKMKNKMLDAFHEWVYFSRKNESLIENIYNHTCFSLALASLKSPLTAKTARLAVNTVLRNMKTSEMETQVMDLTSQFLSEYMNQCNAAIKDDEEHALELITFLKIFTLKFLKLMITKSDENLLKLLNYLVGLTRNQDLSIDLLDELGTFWSELPNDLFELLKNSPFNARLQDFNEIFRQLIQSLCQRIKMEEDQFESPALGDNDEDEQEEFGDPDKKDERRFCRDLMLHIKDILGFPAVFEIICQNYDTLIAKICEGALDLENVDAKSAAQLESLMYAVNGSLSSLKEKPDMTEFADMIVSVKFSNKIINRTKELLIENITRVATVSESTMASIMEYLLDRLPKVATKDLTLTGEVLMSFCEQWSSFVMSNFESYLEMREQFDQDSEFVAALGLAIIKSDQTELQEVYLAQLCTPYAERILKNVEIWENTKEDRAIKDIILNVNRLAFIFEEIFQDPKDFENKANPLESFFQQLWPILKTLFEKFPLQSKVIGRVCHLMKKCMRALGTKFEPFIVEYLEVICEQLKKDPHPSCLYALEVSVSIFGKTLEEPMTKAFEIAVIEFMKEMAIGGLQKDLVEDYFGMLFRYTKYLPKAVLYSNTLDKNLRLTEKGFEIEDTRIEKTVLLFVEYLFKLCGGKTEHEIAKATTDIMVDKYGSIFMKKLIQKFIPYPVDDVRQYILDAVFASFIYLKNHTIQWLESAFEQIPEAILSQTEKQDMIEALNKIDVTIPKPEPKTENKDDPQEFWQVSEDFFKVFDLFEFRCRLAEIRKAKFERYRP